MYIYLGQKVKTGRQKDATVFIVKRIDTEQNIAYIVAIDGSFGQWYSIEALYSGA